MEPEQQSEKSKETARPAKIQSAKEILQATKLMWNSRRGIELNDATKNSLVLNMNDHGSESYLSKNSTPR